MAVSEATARKAVEAWNLDGRAVDHFCGCRAWVTGPSGRKVARIVQQCERHRPALAPRDR